MRDSFLSTGLGLLALCMALGSPWIFEGGSKVLRAVMGLLMLGAASMALLIHLRRRMEAELVVRAFRDELTDLPNRGLFMERLQQALVRLERHPGSVALLFLDLDQFKVVNDSLSYEQGDQLLIQVARRLQSLLRPEDTVARLGGDDFVILLEDLGAATDAMIVAERIRLAFLDPFPLSGQEVCANWSMGLAMTAEAQADPSDLLRDAEVAMYRAKARPQGGSAIEVFDPSMHLQALQRLHLETELRRALERGEFQLHYQPVVGFATGCIEGWEALVRWRHPERGLVPPLDFIPLVEENGMIVPLGKWILREACRQASLWNQRFSSDPPRFMNVNISGRQFQSRDLVDTIQETLRVHQLAPGLLKLEITESVMMLDSKASLDAMTALQELDIHLVIDDFGTGYSSLNYLRRFPVDTLKVDKSFVDGLGKDAESGAIVQAVISLAKALGLRVVAEGIETAEQFALLRDLGCDQGQGYHLSRPLPPDQAEELLARNPKWEILPLVSGAEP